MTTKPSTPNEDAPREPIEETRRGFLAGLAAMSAWAAAFAAPVAAAAVAFFNPLRVKGQGSELLRVGTLDVLPADGTPRRFPIVLDHTDAWNYFPKQPVGAVFLRRTGDNAVEAVQSTCPHAGCGVQFDSEKKLFVCPCHSASFEPTGKRIDPASSDSPRDLDTLETEIRGTEIWVKFEKFRAGTPEKIQEV